MSSLDYLDLCRLCLVKDRVSVPIFEGEGDVRQIFLKIAACLPVKVAREDKLPKKICDDCVYKVELFYQFWNTTANAEKQLLQWLGEVNLEDKQGYVTNVLNPSVMKQEQNSENRLDGNVMQQVGDHQNNMGMGMMDNMGLGIPMMMSNANQQQITSVPMDTSGNSVQTVQAVPGPSSQTTHNQISQNQTSSTQQEDEEESSEDEENSDEECDGDEGLPVKEESEEDPSNRTIEPTTFVNVSLACDEAGPSGLQQQKISDMPEMPIPQPADGDPKSGRSTIAEMSLDQGRNDRVSYQVTVPSTSLIEHNEKPLKIEIDYEDSEKCSRNYENEIINDNSSDLMMDSVKTVLVPVRDPVTKEIKNMLVPVEVKDESGLNIIKSVLIPIYDKDGLVSYEIKKVVVPIQPERTQHQTKKVENKVIVNKGKSNQVKCKKEEEEEEEAEAEKEHSPTEDKKKTREKSEKRQQKREPRKKTEEWSKYVSQETPEDLSQVNKPKGEVDHILDTLRNICPFCQRCFENEKKMQRHAVKAHKKPYKCDKCRKGYFTDFGLEEHKKTHEVISVYQCTICQMQYKTMNGLSNHQMREHSNLDPKYTCDYCGKRFKLKVDLRSHIERAHINPMHICRFCGIAVKSITHHELLHEKSKKINASYDCKYCSRKFKVWYNLENHLLMKHKDPRASPDMLRTLFERKFGSRSDFYQHMHNQTEVKQHKCEVCKKTFVSEFSLSNHMTLHAQTFSCAQCSKTVTNKYSLKLHMRTHTGERPYQCKVCLKTFTRSASLRIHGLTHTGERPYVCDLCGQSFTQRSSMMVHRRKHPGDHPRPPPFILRRKRKHANNEH